jgi:hypothetical protein
LSSLIFIEIEMKNKETKKIIFQEKTYNVPPGGSLGLLALGNIGVRAWKEARDNYLEKNPIAKDEKK